MAHTLKALRKKRGLSQPQLATKAKISQPYVAMLETGQKGNPSLEVLRRLAKVLKVDVGTLLK